MLAGVVTPPMSRRRTRHNAPAPEPRRAAPFASSTPPGKRVAPSLTPWLTVAALGVLFWIATRPAPPSPVPPPLASSVTEAPRAPGTLRATPIDYPQPLYNQNDDQCQIADSRWSFPGQTLDDVRARFHSAGFNDATRDALITALSCDATGCAGVVPDELLRRLPGEPRGRLYRGMAATRGQMFASNPHRRPMALPSWASLAQSPAVASLLRDLAWSDGDTWYLADVATACHALPERAQRVELLSVLRRRVGLDVRVALEASDAPEAVARYWTLPDAQPDPALTAALADAKRSSATVPLRRLLSGWPARRLGTYPRADEPDRDCFWSTLHFHDDTPDRYEVPTPEAFWSELNASWREVPPRDARFGDAVVLMGPQLPLHAMIYLANDLAFTKNGRARSRPWLVSTIEVVRRDYPELSATRFFRRAR